MVCVKITLLVTAFDADVKISQVAPVEVHPQGAVMPCEVNFGAYLPVSGKTSFERVIFKISHKEQDSRGKTQYTTPTWGQDGDGEVP